MPILLISDSHEAYVLLPNVAVAGCGYNWKCHSIFVVEINEEIQAVSWIANGDIFVSTNQRRLMVDSRAAYGSMLSKSASLWYIDSLLSY